jgi:autotransporter-associated beta strand protein
VAGGLLALSGANSYSGLTTVSNGTLNVQSGGAVGLLTVQSNSQAVINGVAGDTSVSTGGILSGSGSVGALSLSSGSLLNPGNSPGTLTAASAVVSGGSVYNWQISAINGIPGKNWDLLNVTGLLDMSGVSSSNKWNLVVTGDSGFTGWTDTNSYSYVFAQAANVSGFSSVAGTDITDLFNISTSGIASVPNASFNSAGDFKVVVGSSGGFTTLNLMAVPEPSAGALLIFGLGGLLFTRVVRRAKV